MSTLINCGHRRPGLESCSRFRKEYSIVFTIAKIYFQNLKQLTNIWSFIIENMKPLWLLFASHFKKNFNYLDMTHIHLTFKIRILYPVATSLSKCEKTFSLVGAAQKNLLACSIQFSNFIFTSIYVKGCQLNS